MIYDLISHLPPSGAILDLGSGGGSFDYSATQAKIIGLDLAVPEVRQAGTGALLGNANRLPIKSRSIDVVVCNHTLEHFDGLEMTLLEIGRVLKPEGALWAAIPDGFSFDDGLYRFTFEGGGHVNRFSFNSFVGVVEGATGLRLRRYKELFSGFVYLNPPEPEKVVHYPRRARMMLSHWPPSLLRSFICWLNYATRLLDGWFGTRMSHYGWGFVFERSQAGDRSDSYPVVPEEGYQNVCLGCGAGHPAPSLQPILKRKLFLKTYACPCCGVENFFFPS